MIFRKNLLLPPFSNHFSFCFLEKLSLSSFSMIRWYDFLYGHDVLKDFCYGQGIMFKRRLQHRRNYVILLNRERCKQIFLQSITLSGGCQRSRNTNNNQGMRAIARLWRACARACFLRQSAIFFKFKFGASEQSFDLKLSDNIKIFYPTFFYF